MRLILTSFALLLAVIVATPADACHGSGGASRGRLASRRAAARPAARVVTASRTVVRVGTPAPACPAGSCPGGVCPVPSAPR